jgi:hypothetical protein
MEGEWKENGRRKEKLGVVLLWSVEEGRKERKR